MFFFTIVIPEIQVSDNTTVLVYEGNSTSFTCTATGSPRPAIIWSRTGSKGNLGNKGRIQKTEGVYMYYKFFLTLIETVTRKTLCTSISLHVHVYVDDNSINTSIILF